MSVHDTETVAVPLTGPILSLVLEGRPSMIAHPTPPGVARNPDLPTTRAARGVPVEAGQPEGVVPPSGNNSEQRDYFLQHVAPLHRATRPPDNAPTLADVVRTWVLLDVDLPYKETTP